MSEEDGRCHKDIVYIAGPISGTTDYMERFKNAEEAIKRMYKCFPINPTIVSEVMIAAECTYEQFMNVTNSLLKCCNAIYLLEGWQHSSGAVAELKYALDNGFKIFTE